MRFELVGEISGIDVIAEGRAVRARAALEKRYGKGWWRKLEGIARVRLADGTIWTAELHWFEAHGIGRRNLKIKRYLS